MSTQSSRGSVYYTQHHNHSQLSFEVGARPLVRDSRRRLTWDISVRLSRESGVLQLRLLPQYSCKRWHRTQASIEIATAMATAMAESLLDAIGERNTGKTNVLINIINNNEELWYYYNDRYHKMKANMFGCDLVGSRLWTHNFVTSRGPGRGGFFRLIRQHHHCACTKTKHTFLACRHGNTFFKDCSLWKFDDLPYVLGRIHSHSFISLYGVGRSHLATSYAAIGSST